MLAVVFVSAEVIARGRTNGQRGAGPLWGLWGAGLKTPALSVQKNNIFSGDFVSFFG